MFKLAITFLDKLNYSKKMALLGILFSMPVAITHYFLLSEINKGVDFAQKELIGASFNQIVMKYLRNVQQYRGMMNAYLQGEKYFEKTLELKLEELEENERAIDSMERKYGGDFKSEKIWQKIKSDMTDLRKSVKVNSGLTGMNAETHFKKCTEAINLTLQMITIVADFSNLTLDPDVDTYYLMDSVVTKIPPLTEYAGITRGFAAGIASKRIYTLRDRDFIIGNLQIIELYQHQVIENGRRALEDNPDLNISIGSGITRENSGMNTFIDSLKNNFVLFNRVNTGIDTALFFNNATDAIDSSFSLYDKMIGSLETLLQKRIDKYYHKKIFIIMFSISIYLIVIYLFSAHLMSMVNALKEILSSSRRLASGEFSNRIYMQRKDELATISLTFNDMAQKLENSFSDLRHSEQRMRALLYALPDSMARVDGTGKILDYKSFKGQEGSNILPDYSGQSIETIFPGENHPWLEKIQKVIQDQNVEVSEFQVHDDSGIHDLESRIARSDWNEAIVIFRDVSERKRVERMKDELISMVSHELRTPLTSIRGALGLISGEVVAKIPADVKKLIDIANFNSIRLVNLINDILDIEKMQSGKMDFKMSVVDLIPQVTSAIEANKYYARDSKVNLELIVSYPEARVKIDTGKFMQVMANLLSNAIKFSPENGRVLIKVEKRENNVRISVNDNGPGIAEKFRSRIFEKFAQADSSSTRGKGGTGLGLNICKMIIDRMGGIIDFETIIGKETTFYFDLPDYNPLTEEPADTNKISSKPCILVCEDDKDIANLLKMMLSQTGFSTEVAYTAAEAKKLLATKKFSAMTLDLMLPDQDGIALLREIKQDEKTAGLHIVVVSIKAESEKKGLIGSAMEVVDWISKPIDVKRLLSAVKMAVTHEEKSINSVHFPTEADALTNKKDHSMPRILHLEDDKHIFEIVSNILNNHAETINAPDIESAIKMLEQNNFDLIILDINLPDGSGFELLKYLSQHKYKQIPVVVFSVEDIGREMSKDISASLVKTRTSNQELVQTIKNVLGLI